MAWPVVFCSNFPTCFRSTGSLLHERVSSTFGHKDLGDDGAKVSYHVGVFLQKETGPSSIWEYFTSMTFMIHKVESPTRDHHSPGDVAGIS